ncbi:MAG TPA: Holliday junction resolvase RuvX [Chloroflexi bacterium]|nr:MAG: Holliday junction resolvase RuvX [Chloroflexota bacterium]HDN05149.1 Holliday junction resolvase RuvX [Chloroflexota bacterium]
MLEEYGRILAIDPGEKRLGLAISDPTQTIASPLMVLKSQSMKKDALAILKAAEDQGAVLIIIGQPLHWDGTESAQAEGSRRLANLVRELGSIPVELADEYGTTQAARETRQKMNVSREKRAGHLDDLAAAILLQNYLDTHDLGAQE